MTLLIRLCPDLDGRVAAALLSSLGCCCLSRFAFTALPAMVRMVSTTTARFCSVTTPEHTTYSLTSKAVTGHFSALCLSRKSRCCWRDISCPQPLLVRAPCCCCETAGAGPGAWQMTQDQPELSPRGLLAHCTLLGGTHTVAQQNIIQFSKLLERPFPAAC